MTTRTALYDLVAARHLDRATSAVLWGIADFDQPPPALLAWLKRGMLAVAAGLLGFGLICGIAANWQSLDKLQQFALLQGFVLSLCLGAALLPTMRTPLGLLGLISIGGLFAYFGQTYQTGADPWQLFAVWASLGIPLALCSRSDSVWSAWAIIVLTAVSLWDHANSGYSWHFDVDASEIHTVALLFAAVPPFLMTKPLRKFTGSGIFAYRIALSVSALFITGVALAGLQHRLSLHYMFSVALFVAAAFALALPRFFDVYAASVTGLALNALLVAGLASILFSGSHREWIGALLLLGLAAAGLLAATARTIMHLSRKYSNLGEP